MPEERNQWVDAIARLTALTQEGLLSWNVDSAVQDSTVTGPTYSTEYKSRRLRLQKRRIRLDYEWVDKCFLEFTDYAGNVFWAFPETDAVEHLYAAAGYQAAGVKDFLQDLLSNE